eukprot:SAG31_NODE_21991_length_536_cov_0.913043_1_plen_89_part_10
MLTYNTSLTVKLCRWTAAAWHASATGKYSKKAVKRSYERRKRRAEIRVMDKAEESGYSGPITEEMIMEEMTTEAVETISTKHMQIQLGE